MLRILLIGEFSGVHTDLAVALRQRGHYVITASSGDAFKNHTRDFDLRITAKTKVLRYIQIVYIYIRFLLMLKKKKFDIIQLINPDIFPGYFDNFIFSYIFKTSSKLVLLACGDDAIVWKAYKEGMYRYFPFDGLTIEEKVKYKSYFESGILIKRTKKLIEKADMIIPLLVEYHLAYKKYIEKLKFIPLSINCSTNNYISCNKVKEKIKIYHPVNICRQGEKGTAIILQALEKVEKYYSDKVEVIVTYSIPFTEYKNILKGVNIVIDQTSCYSPSMNALYSMSNGKVVLGGGEKEYFKQLNIDNAPIINIIPDSEFIYNTIVSLINCPDQIEKIGKESIEFVKQHHSIEKNVIEFEKAWAELLQPF